MSWPELDHEDMGIIWCDWHVVPEDVKQVRTYLQSSIYFITINVSVLIHVDVLYSGDCQWCSYEYFVISCWDADRWFFVWCRIQLIVLWCGQCCWNWILAFWILAVCLTSDSLMNIISEKSEIKSQFIVQFWETSIVTSIMTIIYSEICKWRVALMQHEILTRSISPAYTLYLMVIMAWIVMTWMAHELYNFTIVLDISHYSSIYRYVRKSRFQSNLTKWTKMTSKTFNVTKSNFFS